MEATLVKIENGYAITDCEIIAFISNVRTDHRYYKLCMTNCEELFKNSNLDKIKVKIQIELDKPVLDKNNCLILNKTV